MKYCTKCGQKLEEGTKFCTKCGQKVDFTKSAVEIQPENDQEKDKKGEAKSSKVLIIALIAAVVVLVVILCIVIMGKKDSKKSSSTTEGSTVTEKTTSSTTESDMDTSEFPYTENEYANPELNLTKDDYYRVYSDEGYYFSYPKYMYSEGSEAGGEYLFVDSDNNYELDVYSLDDIDSGNPHEVAVEDYEYYVNSFDVVTYKFKSSGVDEEGFSRTIIAGKEDSTSDFYTYMIIANDGDKHYILKHDYYDDEPDNDYDAIGYINDCIYRYCSFGGSTYEPRTYNQFLKDDMGTKK